MRNIPNVLHFKHEHRAIHASKNGLHDLISALLKTLLMTLAALVVLVGLSSAVWFATWHADISTIKWSVN
jgi:hypothetical protein